MKKCELNKLVTCFYTCLKLKSVLRSSFVNFEKKRRESVAEHSWMLSLMVVLVAPYLKPSFCLTKALKIALIHDIGESLIGDINLIELLKDNNLKSERYVKEKESINKVFDSLEKQDKNELLLLWFDFEERGSYEAKVVAALDKIEAQVQQNKSREKTLDQFKHSKQLSKLDDIFEFDEFIQGLKNEVLKNYEEMLHEY